MPPPAFLPQSVAEAGANRRALAERFRGEHGRFKGWREAEAGFLRLLGVTRRGGPSQQAFRETCSVGHLSAGELRVAGVFISPVLDPTGTITPARLPLRVLTQLIKEKKKNKGW